MYISPVAGAITGIVRENKHIDPKVALGHLAIIIGIILIQLKFQPATS
jgi:drug/metabolite transporter (DMT)-like permease